MAPRIICQRFGSHYRATLRQMIELSDRCFVIAEAGTCHATPSANDRFGCAMRYVEAANNAGADCVKFQIFDNTDLFCPYPGDEQRQARWNDSWLMLDDWRQIKEFAEACGMVFLASVFQKSTVEMMEKMKVDTIKVASRAAKRFPYHDVSAQLLISTGMEFLDRKDAIYLECESNYPSASRWLNNFPGFSDHSGTPWRAVDAMLRGCQLVEVHYFIDPLDAGPDLPASLNLDQLRTVCEARDAIAELRSME